MKKLGAQLYTVRSMLDTAEGIEKAMKAIKEIGYDSVQFYGSAELVETFAPYALSAGLEIAGALVDMRVCTNDGEKLFEVCKRYGITEIGISSSPGEIDETAAYIERVNAFAKIAKEKGFAFSYHNHAHEFIKNAEGKTPMPMFLQDFNAGIDFMPDTYWLQEGGYDVRHFLQQTAGRVNVLHLKDMKHTAQGHRFAEVGNGNIWFEGVIETASACGVEHFVVEQDSCDGDPLESLRISYANAKALIGG